MPMGEGVFAEVTKLKMKSPGQFNMVGMSGNGTSLHDWENEVVLLQIPTKKSGVEPGIPILETSEGTGAAKTWPRISGLQKFGAVTFYCLSFSVWRLQATGRLTQVSQRRDFYHWSYWGENLFIPVIHSSLCYTIINNWGWERHR